MTAAEELEKLYEAAERKLVEIIARKASAGSAAAYERQILKQVSAELKKLRRATPELVRQMVLSGYRAGLEGAVEDILKVDLSLPHSYNLFSRVNTRQIDLIVQNTVDSLTKATRIVGRRMEDEIRAAGLRAAALKEATGGTVGDMQKDLEKRLLGLDLRQAGGKIGVRYKNGKVVSLKDYSKMVARTTTAEAQNKAKIVQAEEWGYDLAECTTHAPTCEVCAMYQGRVYALTKEAANGKHKGPGGEPLRFPYLYDTALVHGYETIHPNCRHRFIIKPPQAYTKVELEKLSRHSMQPFRDTRSDAERKAYAKEQSVTRARNADRREWETYRRALPDEAYARFSDFRRAKQANSQQYQELKSNFQKQNRYSQNINSYEETAQKIFSLSKEKYGEGVTMSAASSTLDSDDEKAIYDYMSSGVAYSLNASLRSGIPLSEQQELIKQNIDKALLKLPDYTGVVYRSLSSEYLDVSQFFRDHSEGNLIRYDAFTSTSKEIYDETMDIQIVMKVKHGKDISKWNDNESEVLLPRGTRFCVIKTDGKTIYMEEL
ncbi:MAG: phage minor capsid protein [[Clostridium] leptum]